MLELERAIAAFRRRGNFDIADELEAGLGRYQKKVVGATAIIPTEHRRVLEKSGQIYPLSGQTVTDFQAAGNPFWHVYSGAGAERSIRTEVYIDPRNPFLRGSNNKTYDERQEMVERYARKIENNFPGLTAVMGNEADHTELALAHFEATGKRLYHDGYAGTSTLVSGSGSVFVGYFYDLGLGVCDWHRDNRNDYVWAAPLVVPLAAVER